MVEVHGKGQGGFGVERQEEIMKFGYTIVYVPDVLASVEFFEKAFGLKRRFVHESGYGEMDTCTTALAFANHDLGASNLPAGYSRPVNPTSRWALRLRLSRTMSQQHTQRQ